jgi:hypothetical protein
MHIILTFWTLSSSLFENQKHLIGASRRSDDVHAQRVACKMADGQRRSASVQGNFKP